MGLIDDIRAVLRAPGGADAVHDGDVPADLLERCRRRAYAVLADRTRGSEQSQRWLHPDTLRATVAAAWRAAAAGVFGVAPDHERMAMVEEAIAELLERPVLRRMLAGAGAIRELEVQRVADLAERATAPRTSMAARYLVEIGALDPMGARLTSLGELLLKLGVREQVIALLHAEALQSTGDADSFRSPRWVFRALARKAPLNDPRGFPPWPSLDRIVSLGLLVVDANDELVYVEDRLDWLADVADERSPLGILVRSTLDDGATAMSSARTPPDPSQRAVRDLAEIAAHELGNTLSTMNLTLGQLAKELGEEERHVVRLRTSVSRLQTFASSLDKLLPASEPETAMGLLDVLHDALDRTRAERNGHLELALALSDTLIRARRSRLRLAFENLVRNAAQAAQIAGRTSTLTIRGGRVDGRVEVRFEDDGPGVPIALLSNLFERGVSGRGSSGLGLALVREVVHEHGGSVHHERPDGGGARFVLVLPRE